MISDNSYKKDIYEIIIGDTRKKRPEIISIYNVFIKNRGKKYSDLVKSLYEEYGREFNIDMLKTLTSKIRKYYSVSKGEEMQYIVLLAVSLEKNDQETINKCNNKLDQIESNKNHSENRSYTYMGIRAKELNKEKHDEKLEKAKKIMQKIVNGEQLDSDEKADTSFNQFIKNRFKEFDADMYMEYFIKVNGIEKISSSEVDQLLEVVNFFLDNLYFTKISPIKQYLYNSNVRGLEARIDLYSKYRNMLIELKENNDFDCVKYIENISRKVLLSEYEFINDFYQNILKINKVKKIYIDGLLIQQKNLEEVKEQFTRKIIKK